MNCVLAFWSFQDGHLLEFLDSGLSLRRFGSVVAEFVDESLQMGSLGHLIIILALSSFTALFFGSVKGVEVGAFIIIEALRVLVNDVGCYLVQKGSIVGDDKERAWVGLEVAGEESDGGDVQHVGRFWEILASILGVSQEVQYHQVEAGLARRRVLLPRPVSSSNPRRRFWWHSAAFLLRSQDLLVCLQLEIRPCPTPFRKAWHEYR